MREASSDPFLLKGAPLTGVRVVELSTMITAPLAGMLLADMGADVLKIENPDGGDPFRNFRGGAYSPHFCAYNRNKRSVTLDLRSGEGCGALAALLADSDVLLANFRPGVLDRLGFSDERLAGMNRRLIRCYISGFGPDGPYADRPAYDAVAQALGGMSSLFLDADQPQLVGPTIADNATGHYACEGILAALYVQQRTGLGRRIDVNMLESAIAFMPDPFAYLTQMGLMSDPMLRPRTSQSYVFRCQDGKALVIHLSSQAKFWDMFADVVDMPSLRDDPDLASRGGRIQHYEKIRDLAAPVFAAKTQKEWLETLSRVDLPFAPVHDVAEVFDDPQVNHLGTFMTLEHPIAGSTTAIRHPVWFDRDRSQQPNNPPPILGEHTGDVLEEIRAARSNEVASQEK